MQNNETGRSMVEILGVLAIVGLLSIVMIKAYPYAMNRHRASEISDGVSSRAMVATMEKAQYGEISLTGYPDKIGGYPVTANTNFGTEKARFEILVSEVPEAVCENLMVSKPVNAVYVYGGIDGRAIYCAEINQMAFIFNDT